MTTKRILPLKGFRDVFPTDMAVQNYIFGTVRSVAALYGFMQYDGPLVEPIELYEGKTSRELLEKQAFTLQDRKGNTLMLRPEMTPSLARMVAGSYQEIGLPVRLFNIGLRYRYEAPQKGRDREFYQLDFDILGSDSETAEIELISAAADIFRRFGATEKDFVIYINSRSIMQQALSDIGITEDMAVQTISAIDKKEKLELDAFEALLDSIGLSKGQIQKLNDLLSNTNAYAQRFTTIMSRLTELGVADVVQVNPTIVRGLDYYTGIVFEVKSKGPLQRSLLGGGRYDNLVGMFGTQESIPGVGFATSETVLREFLTDSQLLPKLPTSIPTVLVTVFSEDFAQKSLMAAQTLRKKGIATELYTSDARLPKQFAYANKRGIPYVIVIGPDEAAKDVVVLKNMETGGQIIKSIDEVASKIS